jgi:hypothetical protein
MAVSGTYKTYDQVGKKEDVEDIIYDISPTETPFLSSIGSGTATATLHQWQQDSLAAVATNAAVEGADAGTSSVDETVLKTNNTQIFTKVVQVSGTAEAVGKYGRTSELAYQIAKKGKEMKRDIEHSFVGAGQAGTAGSGAAARQLTSAQNQISATTTDDNGGTNRAFTETILLNVLQSVYEEGGNPNQLQVTPSHSVTVANFAASSGRQRDFAEGTKLVNVVDIYVSPFGEVSVVPNRFMNANQALVVDTEYWSRAVLRPMQTIVLSKNGDSDKRQMLTELTLVCENDKASGLCDDLTA